MKSLVQHYKIKASVDDVWNALTDPEIIKKWGGGPAVMSDKENFDFRLWNGDIWGRNTKVIKYKLLVQDWYSGNWDEPSIVTFELKTNKDITDLALTHTNIPDDEFSDISSGWYDFYLGPLKSMLEL